MKEEWIFLRFLTQVYSKMAWYVKQRRVICAANNCWMDERYRIMDI